jgi:hypothetical protein
LLLRSGPRYLHLSAGCGLRTPGTEAILSELGSLKPTHTFPTKMRLCLVPSPMNDMVFPVENLSSQWLSPSIPRTSKACKNIALSELCDIFLKRHFFWLRALFHFKMVEVIFQKLTVYMSLIAPTDLLSSRECYLISFAPVCVAWYCQYLFFDWLGVWNDCARTFQHY